MSRYWYLTFVYFIDMKAPVDFRMAKDTSLAVLKYKLDNLLHHANIRKVGKIKYHSPSIDNEGIIRLSKFKLKKNKDLKVIWSTYHSY